MCAWPLRTRGWSCKTVPVVISRVTFSEKNDARPTLLFAGLAGIALIADHAYIHYSAHHPSSRSLYILSACLTAIAAVLGMYCLMGCIWHPIPADRRSSQLITVQLSRSEQPAPTAPPAMFSDLDTDIASTDDEAVDSSQLEIRSPIQWAKMCIVLASVGIDLTLMVLWTH